jgi:zinc/manganese transport system permease protein
MEAFFFPFFGYALLTVVVLAGIHAYLGFHVVRRGVIFVDLAIAQMAALGVALSVVLDLHEQPLLSWGLALCTTFVAALLFAWLRGRSGVVPLEAFIGITFATAQALVFLVMEKVPSGPEHLKETLVGTLFTVSPADLVKTAVLYVIVGIVHFLLRRPLLEITHDAAGARARGRNLFAWDFLFYAMFGVVVTSSVRLGGVLLVFGLLVIPSVAGLLASERTGRALAVGWIFAILGGIAGLIGAVRFDLPASPSILVTLVILLVAWGFGLKLARHGGRAS